MKESLQMHLDTEGCFYLVCWNFLGCARRTHNKMNICHEFVIEHQSIPEENEMQQNIMFLGRKQPRFLSSRARPYLSRNVGWVDCQLAVSTLLLLMFC